MIRSYLEDRFLTIREGHTKRKITCGVPQRSVIGPALWNIFYDGLLETTMPPGEQMVCFAVDVALVGVALTGPATEPLLNEALDRVSGWKSNNELSLAPQKSEAIMLSQKRFYTNPLYGLVASQFRW